MKFYFKKQLLFSAIYILIIIGNTSCISFRDTNKKVVKEFNKVALSPVIYQENYKGNSIRFIASKAINNTLPTLLFVHGSPGACGDYFRYLKDKNLNEIANLIAVDRLGYGYSNFGNAETSIEKQAESIYTIIKAYKLTNVILIGWSFGVPIAAKMAYKYPEVKHSVLVAGAISPKDEKFFGIAKIAQWKLTKWMVPKVFKVADKEKRMHVAELTKMLDNWAGINTPITYYHGSKDKIVPYANMRFIKEKVNKSLLNDITVKGGSHFILSKEYEMVKRELLKVSDSIVRLN